MNATMPVYVNAERVEVPPNATVLDALWAWSADAAREVSRGIRMVTDSRGLPAPLDAPVYGGAILRVTAPRPPAASGDLLR